jgi:hypothetical protein
VAEPVFPGAQDGGEPQRREDPARPVETIRAVVIEGHPAGHRQGIGWAPGRDQADVRGRQ